MAAILMALASSPLAWTGKDGFSIVVSLLSTILIYAKHETDFLAGYTCPGLITNDHVGL